MSVVSFPGIGIGNFEVNPYFFGTSIRWYAIFIVCGMIAAVAYTIVQAKKIGITLEDVIDIALFTIPFGIIGARLYYVLTKLDEFKTLGDAFAIWNGGLAIYGGIIAGGITVLCVCYYKKINFLAFADCVSPGVLLAQGIGRWGNFMNGEAYGVQTDSFIRMGLQNHNVNSDIIDGIITDVEYGSMAYVHPTFLYESLWNLLGVLVVYLFAKFVHKKYDGQLFLMIFGWYGLGRMLIEGLRTDSLYFGPEEWGIRISQALAALILVVTSALLIYFAIKKPNRPFYHKDNSISKTVKKGKK